MPFSADLLISMLTQRFSSRRRGSAGPCNGPAILARVNDSLAWLPPHAQQRASCSWTDAKAWALVLGLAAIAFVAAPLTGSSHVLQMAVGITSGCLVLIYSYRVLRVRVDVGPAGVDLRSVTRSRHIPWTAVASVNTGSGPVWLAAISPRS